MILFKKPECTGDRKALPLFALVFQKVSGSDQCKTGHGGERDMGIGRGDNTSITHCQILLSIPTASCVLRWVQWTFRLMRLFKGDVTTLIYITAPCNKQFLSFTRRWTCIAKHANGFGSVTGDISTGTTLTTEALLTAEPTASFPKYSLMLSSSFSKCYCLPHRRTHHRNVGRTSRSSASTCSRLHCQSQEFREGTTNWKCFLAKQQGNLWCEKQLSNLFHKISWIRKLHL